jgi:4-carboxymuconolactone decarboxylase
METPMPRIPEIPTPLDRRQQAIFERIKAGPRGRVRGPLALWLYSPDLAERAQSLGEFLRFGSVFAPRLSELIILIVARHFDCDYEWAVHAPIAERQGLSPEVVRRIAAREEPEFEMPEEATLYRFVRQCLATNRVDSHAFEHFLTAFGERGVVEATAIMGYYALGAYLLNAVELLPDEPAWVERQEPQAGP